MDTSPKLGIKNRNSFCVFAFNAFEIPGLDKMVESGRQSGFGDAESAAGKPAWRIIHWFCCNRSPGRNLWRKAGKKNF